jgi:hypothetical protein
MPEPGVALEKLGFPTIGLFDGQDPGPGHQDALEAIERGAPEDHAQILTDMATKPGPALGRAPKG